ncbi:MAG: M56 family metallopeptidase [Thermoanaerobaculia bacterium]|nr:M56 family metallopeptidase [Thermoanaerobaculia bacterium]
MHLMMDVLIRGSEWILAWLLTYLVHSTVLLGAAWWAASRLGPRRLGTQERLWRLALVGALATAAVQVAGGGALAVGAPIESAAPAGIAPVAVGIAPAVARPAELPPALGGGSVTEARVLPGGPPADVVLAGLWLVGAALLALRLAAAERRLCRRLADRRPVDRGTAHALFQRLVAPLAGAARMRLSATGRLEVPIARGLRRPEVCLPRRVERELTPEQQESVLAHEVAHLARRDPGWRLLYRLVEAALFLQPLNRVARRRLEELAEVRCDDWAVARTGRPLTLARCLTRVADWTLEAKAPLAAPAMATRNSRLSVRVRRLVERPETREEAAASRWLTAAALAVLVATALLVPGFAPRPAPAQEPKAPRAQAPPAAADSTVAPDAPPPPRPRIAGERPSAPPAPWAVLAGAAEAAAAPSPEPPEPWLAGETPLPEPAPLPPVVLPSPPREIGEIGESAERARALIDRLRVMEEERRERLDGMRRELEERFAGRLEEMRAREEAVRREMEARAELLEREGMRRREELERSRELLEERRAVLARELSRVEERLELLLRAMEERIETLERRWEEEGREGAGRAPDPERDALLRELGSELDRLRAQAYSELAAERAKLAPRGTEGASESSRE